MVSANVYYSTATVPNIKPIEIFDSFNEVEKLHSINMSMPVGNRPPPLKPPDIVRIDVDFDGTVIWNQQVVPTKAELEEKFKVIAAMDDQSEIHLLPHAKASYKHVASVMASAQRLGAVKIGLVGNEQFMN